MKIKIDFITNSSSAAFIIAKCHLTDLQILMIKDHIEVAYALTHIFKDKIDFGWNHAWGITETKTHIKGNTMMDDFDMRLFLYTIGISDEEIDYDDHC